MYNLVFLYFEANMCDELKKRLDQIHPHNKFWSVKMIIFFTFFQKFIIGTVLSGMHIFEPFAGGPEHWTPQQIVEGIQTFLLCVEMFIFAIWHMLAYPVEEFNRLDAAISLRAAVEKKNRVDLQNAVKEAIEAGLDDKCDQNERLCAEGHELLRKARQLLENLYPEVTLEGGTSDFVLQTTGAATVHITVDANSRRLVITGYNAGLGFGKEVEANAEARMEDGNGVKVTLHHAKDIQQSGTGARHVQQNGVVDDLATVVHHLCSPSGQVGFLGTFAMYSDILKLRQMAQDQHIAVQLLSRSGSTPCSDEELQKAFHAFDLDGSQGICKQEFLQVLVATNGGSRDDAENELRRLSLVDDYELSFEDFKRLVDRGVFRRATSCDSITNSKTVKEPLLSSF